jgi:hypothetical protein
MNELDLSAIYAEYERSDGRGLSAYHPLLMTRVLLYWYCIGITSSRRIEPDLKLSIPSPSLSCIPPRARFSPRLECKVLHGDRKELR